MRDVKVITVNFDRETDAILREMAKRQKLSLSTIVREYVKDGIARGARVGVVAE